MNIIDAIKLAALTRIPVITAGGPGSGRHAGADAPLKEHGFAFKGNARSYLPAAMIPRKGLVSKYSHPDGRMASTHKSGAWDVSKPGSIFSNSGHGMASLAEHLNK